MPKKKDSEAGVRYRQDRLDLLQDVDKPQVEGEVSDKHLQVAKTCWREARIANAILDRGERKEPGQKVDSWEKLGTKSKQKAIMDFFAGVMTSEDVRASLVKAIEERPLDALKIYVSTIPKDVEVNINQNQTAIVILPGKAGSVANWMEMANGTKAIDGEVLGEKGADAAQTWKTIMEQK